MKKPKFAYRHNPAFPPLQRMPWELHPADAEMLVGMMSIKDSPYLWAPPTTIAGEARHALGKEPLTDYDLGIHRDYHERMWLKSLKFLQGLGYCQDSSDGAWAVVRDDLTMEIES